MLYHLNIKYTTSQRQNSTHKRNASRQIRHDHPNPMNTQPHLHIRRSTNPTLPLILLHPRVLKNPPRWPSHKGHKGQMPNSTHKTNPVEEGSLQRATLRGVIFIKE
jgi:hypothetical protein